MRLLLSVLCISLLSACSSNDNNTSSSNNEIASEKQVSEVSSGDQYSKYIGYWHSNNTPKNSHTIVSQISKDGDNYIVNPDVNFDLAINTTRENAPVVLTPNDNKLVANNDRGNTMELSLSDDGQTLNTQNGSFTKIDEVKANEITAKIQTCVDLTEQYNASYEGVDVTSPEYTAQNKAIIADFADKFTPYKGVCSIPSPINSELEMRAIGG